QEAVAYPIENYRELSNPIAVDPAKWVAAPSISVGWGSTDIRYKKEEPATPINNSKTLALTAWKGERVSAQLVVSNKTHSRDITYSVGEFVNQGDKKHRIKSENIFSG